MKAGVFVAWFDLLTAAFVADLMPTTAHLPSSWIMGYDLYPMDTLIAKQALTRDALDRQTLIFFEHDPAVAVGLMTEQDGALAWRSLGPGNE